MFRQLYTIATLGRDWAEPKPNELLHAIPDFDRPELCHLFEFRACLMAESEYTSNFVMWNQKANIA